MTTDHAPPTPPTAPAVTPSDRPTPAERLAIALGTSQTVPVEAPAEPAAAAPEPLVAD